jgi:chromosome segregation ATPase
MKSRYFIILSLCLVVCGTLLSAAEPASSDGTAALRVALRNKALELQTVQSDLATLQASQGAMVEENKVLAAKYETLKKQIATDRVVTDKSAGALTAQLAEQKLTVARLNEALGKATTQGEKAAQAARAAEAQGTKLTNENILLERRAADREAKNLALFLVANEILSRYEEFSLGNAIRAKEPFVGLTRTKLENLVQDYQDKIQEQRVRP